MRSFRVRGVGVKHEVGRCQCGQRVGAVSGPVLLAQVPGFAILSARLRTLVKQRSVRRMLAPGSRKEGRLEKHFRWKSQLQYS
jgi:hypothetical protein